MSRLIFLLAIVVLIYWLIRLYRKRPPMQDRLAAEDMVSCAHCGVHLPKGESVQSRDLFFCGAAHRDMHLNRKNAD
ncbi:MAG: PP0621 family protein [Pseudomonadota bacterium]